MIQLLIEVYGYEGNKNSMDIVSYLRYETMCMYVYFHTTRYVKVEITYIELCI